MGTPISRSALCCAVRDKHSGEGLLGVSARTPQFISAEVDAGMMDQATFLSFAPQHQKEHPQTRRLAVASSREVRIFQLPDQDAGETQAPCLALTHFLRVDASIWQVLNVQFVEDDASRNIAVILGPPSWNASARGGSTAAKLPAAARGGGAAERPASVVRIWSCKAEAAKEDATLPGIVEWQADEGWTTSLDAEAAPFVLLTCNRQFLFTVDAVGGCVAWQKNRSFQKRCSVSLHSEGVADFTVDRMFAYSVGVEEQTICVWSLPDHRVTDSQMALALKIPVDVPISILPFMSEGLQPASPQPRAPNELLSARVTLLRRPLSRWAGCLGSSRGPKCPRGCLFAAATLSEGCEVAGSGAGLLLEWSLGERPVLTGAQVAHESQIVSLTYGPYDNGPVITGDMQGIFRVWEFTLNYRLCPVQQIDLSFPPMGSRLGTPPMPALTVEPPRCVFAALDGRLHVWRRAQDDASTALIGLRPEDIAEVAEMGSGPRLENPRTRGRAAEN